MGKFGVWLVVATVVATCLGDKDPTILLRPPSANSGGQASPVFSSSINPGLPQGSGSQHQSVYAKGPGTVHSSASASASASGLKGQHASGGGRHNDQWYNTQGNGFNFDYNAGSESGAASSSSVHSSSGGSGARGGYYEQPQQQPPAHHTSASAVTSDSYGVPPSGGAHGPAYTYYYQHYPSSASSGHGWSGGDDGGGLLGGFSGLEIPGLYGGGGLGGIGAVKVVKVVAAIAKGILAVKPFLILGLLFLIAIPVLLLLLPIPIITITGQPATLQRGRSAQITSYLTQLSGKVLNSEECLERIICKLPQPPEKYQTKAKLIWDEYGSRMVTHARLARGLEAYFDSSSQKNRNFKCEQRFKCSNKYL